MLKLASLSCDRTSRHVQTEEAKHQANKNTGSGESLGDKASHAGNVASNKVSSILRPLQVSIVQVAPLRTASSVTIVRSRFSNQML